MTPQRRTPGAEAGRRPARDLIDAVLANMRQNVEPLKYSVLAPSRYVVYLHPREYARLQGVVPILNRKGSCGSRNQLRSADRYGRKALVGYVTYERLRALRGSEP